MTYTLDIDRTLSHLAFYNLARLRDFLATHRLIVYHVSRSPVGRHTFITAR